jgi:hypothetical protein
MARAPLAVPRPVPIPNATAVTILKKGSRAAGQTSIPAITPVM